MRTNETGHIRALPAGHKVHTALATPLSYFMQRKGLRVAEPGAKGERIPLRIKICALSKGAKGKALTHCPAMLEVKPTDDLPTSEKNRESAEDVAKAAYNLMERSFRHLTGLFRLGSITFDLIVVNGEMLLAHVPDWDDMEVYHRATHDDALLLCKKEDGLADLIAKDNLAVCRAA